MEREPLAQPDFRTNASVLWGSFIIAALTRLGVRHVVTSPGSRSTPLTLAAALQPGWHAHSVLDERSAGFFALGLARASGSPVAVVCTSGTAVANLLPAVIEARESGVPLLLLTADRPPELRHARAGQTIDQLKIFGDYPGFFADLPLPEASPLALRHLRQLLAFAVERTQTPAPGPVHLNVGFREPLSPTPGPSGALGFEPLDLLADVTPPLIVRPRPVGGPRPAGRCLVVAGPTILGDPRGHLRALDGLAKILAAPVLVDALHPARHWQAEGTVRIACYDHVLRDEGAADRLSPDWVVQIGDLPTSKTLRSWLQKLDRPTVIVDSTYAHANPVASRALPWRGDLESFADHLDGAPPGGSTAYQTAWLEAARRTEARFDRLFDLPPEAAPREPEIARHLGAWLPGGAPLFVASSMPVRDVEWFWPLNNRRHRFFFNRGANGIDGTLSTALGVAEALREPTYLLTGDLALLHDTNGFLLAPSFTGSLTILLLNNHGGGIFDSLPVAAWEPPFEKFFATPQAVDFAKLAAAYGLRHKVADSRQEIARFLGEAAEPGVRLIEIRLDRQADRGFRQQLAGADGP